MEQFSKDNWLALKKVSSFGHPQFFWVFLLAEGAIRAVPFFR